MSLDIDLARLAVGHARKVGAEYAEARLHGSQEIGAILRNGVPEPAVLLDALGIGVRVLYDGALAFGATNDLGRSSIMALVENVVKRAKASSAILRKRIRFTKDKAGRARWKAEEKQSLDHVGVEDLLAVLREIENLLKDGRRGVTFPNRTLILAADVENKAYVNTDGAELVSRVPRVLFYSYVAAMYEGKVSALTIPPGYQQAGESGGWEVVGRIKLHEMILEEADKLAGVVTSSKKPPAGSVDIILGPDVSGLVAHESSGHAGEADRVLGREAAQAGESYLKPESLGSRIGSKEAYASDDPTIPHSMGYYLYDEEGVPARKRRLIDAGLITEFLHNRATAYEFDLASNAASRSVQYDREPIVRMANTFIEPGDHSFEELVEDVNTGVVIESFMEWNIDDKRFNQRYVGLEARLVEQGKLKDVVRNPVLEITTSKFWSSIDARSKELRWTAATCGKGDPSQGIPVWTGGPYVRLRNVSLGAG